MHAHHAATGRPRTTQEVNAEIAERQASIQRLNEEMKHLSAEDAMWKAKKFSVDRHVSIIAVLRWVLGEDLLWE